MKAAVLALAVLCSVAPAQVAFDAASVKAMKGGARQRRPVIQGGPGTSDPGRIRYTGISLRDLVLLAYRARAYQLAPADAKALDASTYEIVAELPHGTSQEQLRTMLQKLLAERFHLELHEREVTMQGYRLVVAKDGPKLKLSTTPAPTGPRDDFDPLAPAPPNELEVRDDGYPNVPPSEGSWLVVLRSGYGRMHQLSASMADLAGMLSNQLERPVADATRLKGRYEFTLSWTGGAPAAASGAGGPELPTALREQLGLQLAPAKTSVEMLAIDHFAKDPTEN